MLGANPDRLHIRHKVIQSGSLFILIFIFKKMISFINFALKKLLYIRGVVISLGYEIATSEIASCYNYVYLR